MREGKGETAPPRHSTSFPETYRYIRCETGNKKGDGDGEGESINQRFAGSTQPNALVIQSGGTEAIDRFVLSGRCETSALINTCD